MLSAFSTGVQGVGGYFFGTDVSGAFLAGITIDISATDGSGTFNTSLTNTTNSTFLGMVTDGTFTSISISAVQDGNRWPTINDLTLEELVVPEPGTWATAHPAVRWRAKLS